MISKKAVLIPIASIVIIGVFSILIYTSKKEGPETRKSSNPATTQEVQDNQELTTVAFKETTKFAVDKPVEDTGYSIEYDGGTVAYYVSIKATNIESYRLEKQKAEQVILDNGAQNLCQLRIYFAPPREIKNQIEKADLFASNCPPLY